MPEITGSRIGHFCWFELATTDQAAAKKFYSGLFGWTANDLPMVRTASTRCFSGRAATWGLATLYNRGSRRTAFRRTG